MKAGFGIALLMALLAGSSAQARTESETRREYDRLFEETLEHYALPGMAVGVIENGRVVYRRSSGTRLVGSDEAIDAQTLFKIASNSKAMTAAVLARLVDAGKLRWDDPVRRHLPQFRMHDAWVGEQMQVRDLLIHNSGLPLGAGDLMLWPEPNDFSRADIIAGLAHLKPSSSFRSAYAYDNLLYIVAGEVAAAAGGADYETLLRREVFEPLGLKRCMVGAFDLKTVGNVAQPHRLKEGKPVPVKLDPHQVPAVTMAAAGGVRCSLDDMLYWARHWLNPDLAPDWLSQTQREAMWTGHMPMPLRARQRRWENSHFHAYGYGFRLSDVNGAFRAAHTGTLDGMYSAMALFPQSRSGYVILINGSANDARLVLEAALSRVLTRPGSAPRIADFVRDLEAERASSGAAAARAEAMQRTPVAASQVKDRLGIYRDAWFGEIHFCPQGDGVQWVSRRSARMHARLMQAADRLLLVWNDDNLAGAEAWLDFPASDPGRMALKAVDPELDFSYDFHDLAPQRQSDCP